MEESLALETLSSIGPPPFRTLISCDPNSESPNFVNSTQTLDPQNPPAPQTLGSKSPPPPQHETLACQAPRLETLPSSSGEGETGSNGHRRRRSRWDPPADADPSGDGSSGARKKKSRWAEEEPKAADPEVPALNLRLLEISRRLEPGQLLDDRPEWARSPSPEPIYNNFGVRINTREYRMRERLMKEQQQIISELIQRNPAFQPPASYRPPKLQKKLYIPVKEYPGYNFIGLIIGPRGNTQKRMEKETGAKIVIRGRGSVKGGKFLQKRDAEAELSENEDLHVLVEAETQDSLDAAVGMLEKLLQPVDEVLNEHKRQQLRELATLNGTIKDDEFCRLCGESGHRQYACPNKASTFKSEVHCKICGDGGHPTIDCPMKGTDNKMDDEYQNFLAELGGTVPDSLTKHSSALPILGSSNSGGNPPWASGNSAGGTQANGTKKEHDETNLYIGYLPPSLDDDALIRLFSPFGYIVSAKVIRDRDTGMSKGYGFVKYSDVSMANQAIASMHGYHLEGRVIAVRVAGKPPQPAVAPGPPAPMAPANPASNPSAGGYHFQQYMPGGPVANLPPPPGSYAPVPWGPPAPPSYAPYAPYAAPPLFSSMYTPVEGQSVPPSGVQYPPQSTAPSDAASRTMSSGEAMQDFPHGVQSESTMTDTTVVPSNYNGGTASTIPLPAYPPSSLGYMPYYSPVPPPAPPSGVDMTQNMGNVSWASNVSASHQASSAEEPNTYVTDEFKKFMSEIN